MSDVVIRAQGLGKKYVLGRQGGGGARYGSFREALAGGARAAARSARNLAIRAPRARDAQAQEFWALRDLDFEVRRGDVVGVIGRNGAGKSTLLKVLSRITEPTTGRVEIKGRVASLLEVGTGFHPELTGRENVFLNGAILGMSHAEIRRKFDEIVAFAEVETFLDTPVKRYSSGMYVRLAFAVAAHLEPEILVVDEVLAVGDAEFQKKCIGKMQDVAGQGRTVLFVSHNLGAIKQLCTSAIYLKEGRCEGVGPVEALANRYTLETVSRRVLGDSVERLSSEIDLVSLTVADGHLTSFAPADFAIQLRCRARSTLVDLAILIEHDSGQRAATIDCRDGSFPRELAPDTEVLVQGQALSLNLVEGAYTLSVYQRTYDNMSIIRDLGDLVVTESMEGQLHPPYRARDRGSVALQLKFAGDDRIIIS